MDMTPAGTSGFPLSAGIGDFLFSEGSKPDLRLTKLRSQSVTGNFPWRYRRPGREAEHSPSPSGAVKSECSYISVFPHAFMAWRAWGQPYLLCHTQTVSREFFKGNGKDFHRFLVTLFFIPETEVPQFVL